MFTKRCTALLTLTLLTACDHYSSDPAAPPPPPVGAEVVQADGILATANALTAFDTTTDNDRTITLFSGGIGAGFYGLEHGQLEETGKYAGLVVFTTALSAVEGEVPSGGSGTYDGIFHLSHATGISTGPDGTQTAGNTQNIDGDVSIAIDFDTLDFTGGSSDGSGLSLNGTVANGGGLSGTATFGGMQAAIDGLVVGHTSEQINSAVIGGFAGSNATELLIGGFVASDEVEDR